MSDAIGRYIWTGIRTGGYFVEVEGSREYIGQAHDGVDCPDESCVHALGTPFHVGVTELTTGIDFSLERRAGVCIPDANTLCLNSGRFRVTATRCLPSIKFLFRSVLGDVTSLNRLRLRTTLGKLTK